MSRTSSRWDRLNFLRNSVTLGVAQVVAALLSALFFWWLKKIDAGGRLGDVVLCVTVNQLLLVFVHWTQPLYIRDGLSVYAQTSRLSNLFFSRLVFSLGIGAMLLISASWWSGPLAVYLNSTPELMRTALTFFFFQIPFWHVHNSLQSVKLVGALGLMLVIDKLVSLVSVLGFWWFGVLNFETVLFSLILGNATAVLFGVFSLRKYMHFSFPLKTQLRHIGQSFPLIGSLAVAFLTTGALDQFFIRLYLSEQNFVDYFLLFQFYGMFLQFPTLISGLLLNWISATIDEKQTAVITRFFGELIPGVTIAFVVLALVAYGAVSGVLYWFYGLSTDAFALPLMLLMVSSVFSFANIVAYAPYMLAKRQVRMLSFLPFMTAAINLLGNFLLVKPFGITGIATASFFAATLTGLYVHRHIYKELGIKNRTLPLLAVLNSVAVVLVLLSHLTVFGSIFLLLSLNIVFCFLRMQVALQQVKQLRELLVRPTIHLQ